MMHSVLLSSFIFLASGSMGKSSAEIVANVAIVGGGVSGLTTAMNLELAGVQGWIILEARDRLGGRVHTVKFGGYATELGAVEIQGIQRNPFYEKCVQYGVQNSAVNYNLETVVYDGSEPVAVPDISSNTFEQAWACLQEKGDNLNQMYSETLLLSESIPTAREVFEECGWFPGNGSVYFDLEFEFGRAAEQMSIHAFPEYTFMEFDDDEHLVTDEEGMAKFLKGMLNEFLPEGAGDPRIRLSTAVDSIYHTVDESTCVSKGLDPGCVKAQLANNDVVFANYLVSTIPFGSIKASHTQLFPQGFPGMSVVNKFQTASYHKTYLQFEPSEKKWFDHAEFIMSTKAGAPTVIYQPKVTSHPGSAVIQCIMGGDGGDDAESKTPEDMAAYHKQRLEEIYGVGVVPAVRDVVTTVWMNDPFARGAWFQYGPRATPADFDRLKEPIGHLIFSGEHTCGRFYGFVHGAMLAGARDGQRLLEMMGLSFKAETRCEEPPKIQGKKKGFPKSRFYKREGGDQTSPM